MSDLDAMPGTPGPAGCIGVTGPIMGNVVPIPPPTTPNGMTDEEARAVLKAAELSRSLQEWRDALDLHRNDPNPPKNMCVDDANALIFSYFDRLKYPKIIEAKAVLLHELGSVFLVSFEQNQHIIKVNSHDAPCYAIIVNGVVAGYNEDFWSDADKYKLILKCHLGLLQMDAHEADKLKPPVAEKKVEAPRASDETISAVIGRYEELLRTKDAQISAANTETGEWMKKRADIGKLHDDLFFKIKRIEDVISGADEKEKADLEKAKEALKDDPIACMIGANSNWFLGDEESASETQQNPCIEKDEGYLRSIPGQYETMNETKDPDDTLQRRYAIGRDKPMSGVVGFVPVAPDPNYPRTINGAVYPVDTPSIPTPEKPSGA